MAEINFFGLTISVCYVNQNSLGELNYSFGVYTPFKLLWQKLKLIENQKHEFVKTRKSH